MAQYLLSVHYVEGAPTRSQEDNQRAFAQVDALNERLKAEEAWVFGGGLHPPATSTVVRMTNGEVLTTDGPFAEGKESTSEDSG